MKMKINIAKIYIIACLLLTGTSATYCIIKFIINREIKNIKYFVSYITQEERHGFCVVGLNKKINSFHDLLKIKGIMLKETKTNIIILNYKKLKKQ